MPTIFSCAQCGQQYAWKAEIAGKSMKCKKCGHVFPIPGAAPAGQPAPAQGPLSPVASLSAGAPLAGGMPLARPTRLSEEDKAFLGFGAGFAALGLLTLILFRLMDGSPAVFPILAVVLALLGAAMILFGLRGRIAVGIPVAVGVLGAALVIYVATAGGGGGGGSPGPAPTAAAGQGASSAAPGTGSGGAAVPDGAPKLSPADRARLAGARSQSTENLKQLGLAMHNHHDANRKFPLPGSLDPDGKPLLSWRVHLLPFVGQTGLYNRFHLNEPWDSPHNKPLINPMPEVYRHPMSKVNQEGRTNYVVPVGNGAMFDADKPASMADIRDGTSNTLMIVEVDDEHAAVWTKPDDLPFDPSDPGKWLSRIFDGGFLAALGDGSVRCVKISDKPDQLRAMFTRAGGEPVSF